MAFSVDGKVVIIEFVGRGVTLDSFGTVKEMVQHYITATSMAGAWGSPEHVTALCETKDLLERIILAVREDPADD